MITLGILHLNLHEPKFFLIHEDFGKCSEEDALSWN